MGGYPSGVVDLLVKDKTFQMLCVIDDVAELLHDLDIAEINHVGLAASMMKRTTLTTREARSVEY